MQLQPKPQLEPREPTREVPRRESVAHAPSAYRRRRNWLISTVIDLLICIPLVAAICFYDLNSPSINYRDETTHIRAVQSMHQTGNWWTPSVRGNLYMNKPPFKMWLTFIPLKIFGQSAFAYRFLDALAGVLTCTLLYLFGRFAFRSRLAGVAAALLLIGCETYVFGHGVRKAVQDSMLILLTTLGSMLGWLWLQSLTAENDSVSRSATSPRAKILAIGGGVAIGLATLTKSVAGIIPYIVFAVFAALSGRLKDLLWNRKASLALVLGSTFVVSGSYLIPHFLFTPGFFGTMVGQEIVTRATEGYHNQDKLWFYFERLLSDRQAVPPELLVVSLGYFLYCWFSRRSELHLFLAVWSVVPVLLFTVIPSRLTWYISPAFPGMALMAGGTIAAAFSWLKPRLQGWWQGDTGLGLAPIAVTLFLGVAAVTSAGHLAAIAGGLQRLAPRAPADLFVTDVLEYGKKHPGKGGVIRVNAPEYALHESTYGGMIDPVTVSVDSVQEALRLSETGNYAFLLSSLPAFKEMTARKPVLAYRYFPPMYDRDQWMIAFTLSPDVKVRSLTPARRLIKFQGGNARVHFGLKAGESGASNRSSMEGARVGLPVRGDSALKTFGSTIAVNLASLYQDRIRLELFLNDRQLAQFELDKTDLHTHRFTVPPGEWEDAPNMLYLRVTSLGPHPVTEDSSPLILNWISIRLAQPSDKIAGSGN